MLTLQKLIYPFDNFERLNIDQGGAVYSTYKPFIPAYMYDKAVIDYTVENNVITIKL